MAKSVLELIGNTPIVKLSKFDTGKCELFVKLESQNPSGSIKDRIALSMIEEAERSGQLVAGSTLIEATAGNTGLGLAQVAALKGYKLVLVIPDKMSQEKIRQVRALGAEVVLTRSDVGKGHPEYYQDIAERLSREIPNSYYVNQFGNPANPTAHEKSTGPEMWEQMEHSIDAVVCGVGSGGTISGLSHFFEKVSPKTEMVLADPVGSILDHYIKTGEVLKEAGTWLVEGTGEDFIPPVADLSRVKISYAIPDSESFEVARELLRREGILAGPSTGLLVAAALRYCREQSSAKRVVTFICDSGSRYLTKLFDDTWMRDQGLISGDSYGDLRDLISQRVVVAVGPDDTLTTAYNRMRAHGVSQLPVLEEGELRGIIDEWDLLHAVELGGTNFSSSVRAIMTTALETLDSSQDVSTLVPLFERELVPIIMHQGRFVGLVTKIDYLNHLRKRCSTHAV
jgi:cystathionine beta-synthase